MSLIDICVQSVVARRKLRSHNQEIGSLAKHYEQMAALGLNEIENAIHRVKVKRAVRKALMAVEETTEVELKEGSEFEVTGDFRKKALAKWGFLPDEPIPCVACSTTGAWQLHHIVFKSQGGVDHDSNLVPICRIDHDDIHAERIKLIQIEGRVVTWDSILEYIRCETPWPPVPGIMEDIGDAVDEIDRQVDSISGKRHFLISTQLPEAIAKVHELKDVVDRKILELAHERMQRAPRRGRTAAAKALAVELAQRGIILGETMVRSLAGQYEIMQRVGEEQWDATPKMVRVVASWKEPEEGAAIIDAWQDRPIGPNGKRQTVRAFVAAHYEGEVNPFGADYCETCKGDGQLTKGDIVDVQEILTWAEQKVAGGLIVNPNSGQILDPYPVIERMARFLLALGRCPDCAGSGRKAGDGNE